MCDFSSFLDACGRGRRQQEKKKELDPASQVVAAQSSLRWGKPSGGERFTPCESSPGAGRAILARRGREMPPSSLVYEVISLQSDAILPVGAVACWNVALRPRRKPC